MKGTWSLKILFISLKQDIKYKMFRNQLKKWALLDIIEKKGGMNKSGFDSRKQEGSD
jgi:hypothetical protein